MARRSRGFVRPPARTMIWIGSNIATSTIGANTKVLFSVLSAGALLLRPFTVIRSRFVYQWRSDQAAVSEQPHGVVATLVVTETASGVGATAVPDPVSDPEAAYITYQGLIADFVFLSSVGFDGDAGHQYQVDSKSMRKVGVDDDLITIAVNSSPDHGGQLTKQGRTLIKLH